MEPTIPDFDPAEVPEHVVVLCLACAQYVHAATGVALDFTPDTLPLLDHYLQGVRGAKDDVKELVATAAGAYFGELVRRSGQRRRQPRSSPVERRACGETLLLSAVQARLRHNCRRLQHTACGGA